VWDSEREREKEREREREEGGGAEGGGGECLLGSTGVSRVRSECVHACGSLNTIARGWVRLCLLCSLTSTRFKISAKRRMLVLSVGNTCVSAKALRVDSTMSLYVCIRVFIYICICTCCDEHPYLCTEMTKSTAKV